MKKMYLPGEFEPVSSTSQSKSYTTALATYIAIELDINKLFKRLIPVVQ